MNTESKGVLQLKMKTFQVNIKPKDREKSKYRRIKKEE